jgi:hypothetical protein
MGTEHACYECWAIDALRDRLTGRPEWRCSGGEGRPAEVESPQCNAEWSWYLTKAGDFRVLCPVG